MSKQLLRHRRILPDGHCHCRKYAMFSDPKEFAWNAWPTWAIKAMINVHLPMPARTNLFGQCLLIALAITAAVYPSFAIARCHGPGATKICCNRTAAHAADSTSSRQDDHTNRLPEQQCPGTSVCCQMPLMVY